MKRLLLVIMVMMTTWLAASAQVIEDITVQSADGAKVEKEIVLMNMVLKKGSTFSPALLSEDVRNLYGTGQFDDIAVAEEKLESGNIRLVLTVKLKPVVVDIVFEGNDILSDKKLGKKLTQQKDSLLSDRAMAADLAEIYKRYNDKGYHDVEIEQKLEIVGEREVRIVYLITEKSRVKTRGIEVEGNTVFSNRAIKKVMKTDVSFWGYIFPTGYFDEQQFQLDLEAVRDLYLDRGYLDVEVDPGEYEYNGKRSKVYVTVNIREGEPYTVSEVKVEGNTAFSEDEIRERIRLTSGAVFVKSRETADIRGIESLYNRQGYLDSVVRARRVPDSTTNTVVITYTISEGKPSHIRDINISGNTVTKDKVIRRELKILPGDLSDGGKIDASRDRLLNLGYFEKVDVIPLSTDNPELKDLDVRVMEKETGRLTIGAGFSSADDVIGSVEVAQSNFDLENPPYFRGGGQRFRLRAAVGSSRQDYTLSFTEPWMFDRRLRMDASLWRRSTSSNRDWDQEEFGASVAFTKEMKWDFWRQSLGYKINEVRIKDIDDTYSTEFIEFEEGSELVSAFTFGFTRDKRNRYINPSYGNLINIRGEVQSSAIGSYTNLYDLTISGTQYLPVLKKSVLKMEASVSQVESFSGDDPKVFDRLFAGGLATIRGFKERDVGPVDTAIAEPVGGQSRILASAEFMTPIFEEQVFWAFFADAGNVWEDAWQYDIGEINVGAGAGIRLFLPIGAFQFDYGWPIVRDQDHLGSGGRFHFSIGATF